MSSKNTLKTVGYFIVGIFFIHFLGAISQIFDVRPDIMTMLTPVTLIATSTAMLLLSLKFKRVPLVWSLCLIVITVLIEEFSVITGFPFGRYIYSDALGFKLFNVPIGIGINWVLLGLGAYSIIEVIFSQGNTFLKATLAALLLTILDIVMEPVATFLNYWRWDSVSVPIQNYFSWFVISFAIVISIYKLRISVEKRVAANYFISVLLYYVAILLLRVI